MELQVHRGWGLECFGAAGAEGWGWDECFGSAGAQGVVVVG